MSELDELARANRGSRFVQQRRVGMDESDPLSAGLLLGLGWAIGSLFAGVIVWALGALVRHIIWG